MRIVKQRKMAANQKKTVNSNQMRSSIHVRANKINKTEETS